MLADIAGKIIDATIGKGLDAILGKYFPPSMPEADKAKLQAELEMFRTEKTLELQKMLIDEEKAFRDSVNVYENPAGLSKWMLDYRASVRPTITYAAFILLAYILIFGGRIDWARLDGIPQNVWWIFLAIFGFWFGGRAVSDARNGKNS